MPSLTIESLQPTPLLTSLYEEKERRLLAAFAHCTNIPEEIIAWGKKLPTHPDIQQESFLVDGCQSLLYLKSSLNAQDLMDYQVYSQALISSGLAALLLFLYQQEPPQLVLLYPPLIFQKLGLAASLSPGRSNGFAGLYTKMKKDALKIILEKGA